jgi:DNA replication protein DnaC
VTERAGIDEVVSLCRRLRLKYLREQVVEVVEYAKAQRWDPTEVLRVLLQAEVAGRDASTIEAKRRRAGLPTGKTFDVWVPSKSSMPRSTQEGLRAFQWMERGENLVICGPSGTGKSHFCEALCHEALDAKKTVIWFSIEDLGALVRRHRVDDTVSRAFAPIAKADLTVVDDIGMLPVSVDAAEGLYRLVDAAYEKRSVAVSSNLHPSAFDQLMDKNLATALVDRLLHHAHVVFTDGESVRLADATSGKGVVPLDS